MSISQRLVFALRAARELGLDQVGLYACYQLALRTGWLRRITPARKPTDPLQTDAHEISLGLINVPNRDALTKLIGDHASALLAEANDLNHGKVRLFGGAPYDLDLVVPLPLHHWTNITLEQILVGVEDIKYLWEPARFTWIYTLVRAYILSGDESYVETFWREFEAFADINLPNLGPNWVSGQEIALRLISFAFAYQVFCSAEVSTPDRINRLSFALADHAARIPATLIYARAQNNNHLLSEAAGLITAGMALPGHPKADEWKKMGWRWFNHALETQITSSGTYIQQSVNYHRMMLQLAIWVSVIDGSISEANNQRLAAATNWLLGLVDPETGRVPNLGHNDGSYFQPLASCSYADYRPVLQAAAITFLGERALPTGPWDEFAFWLGLSEQDRIEPFTSEESPENLKVDAYPDSHLTLQDRSNLTWACFRVAHFNTRPAHADQLHLDFWWREHNVALDAGTYLYNAPPPWDNSLVHSGVHNTVTIDGRDQMTHAGRFLWLDWAQAEIIDQITDRGGERVKVVGQHDGYRQLGVTHRRSISCESSGKWVIQDDLVSFNKHHIKLGTANQPPSKISGADQIYRARLHWLLPDWSWEIDDDENSQKTMVRLRSPQGWINLHIGIMPATENPEDHQQPVIQLIRAGELLLGTGSASPVSGWVSPTYGYKIPALSLAIEIESVLPIKFTSEWDFPQVS